MKTQNIRNHVMTLKPFLVWRNPATHNSTGAATTTTTATTHDHKEVNMKTQGTSNSKTLATICSLFVFLTLTAAAWGQQKCPTTKSACTDFLGGQNFCPSPQYRFSPDLTGAPVSSVLDAPSIVNNCLQQKFPARTTFSTLSFGPSSSPSVITRTIFASQDPTSGNWGLSCFGVVGGGPCTWATFPATAPIRSSPGYPTHNVYPYIFVGSEDFNLYAIGYTNGVLAWTYKALDAVDSSPTVSDANEVYIVDQSGFIHKVDGNTGTSIWTTPISSNVYPTGNTTHPSAQSVALSTCGGKYPSCNMVIVAGNDTYYSDTGSGYVSAFDSNTTSPLWTQGPLQFPITSSPVVSDSEGLVYVQSEPNYYPFGGAHWTGYELYALDQNPKGNGSTVWTALPPPTCGSQLGPGSSGTHLPPAPNGSCFVNNAGSPAYDDANRKVAVAGTVNYVISNGQGITSSTFENSFIAVYDATRAGNGNMLCFNNTIPYHINYSSPTISNGVVYVGTDEGHMLAFDESNCSNQIWDSQSTLGTTTGAIASPPVVSRDRIHWVDRDGSLWVVGLPKY
jgi:outer membrane protein assembly factor BamB